MPLKTIKEVVKFPDRRLCFGSLSTRIYEGGCLQRCLML